VNFTREPIIETVITPREGYHLAVRSSKGNGHEDYFVDAVEVVSFGHSFFFRSQERPSSFLVPVSDYAILEVKETRMVLKNASIDRSIKIGGGREPKSREGGDLESSESRSTEGQADRSTDQRKRDNNKRRRGRRGGGGGRSEIHSSEETRAFPPMEEPTGGAPASEAENPTEGTPHKAPSFISKLFPPPTTLIKETLSRYKLTESEETTSISEEKIEEEVEKDLDLDAFDPPIDPSTDEETSSED
jgi:hypothetical protein